LQAGARGGGAPRFEPAIAADSPQFRFHWARSLLSCPGARHFVDSKVPLVTFLWVRESGVSVEKESAERRFGEDAKAQELQEIEKLLQFQHFDANR